MAAHFDFRFGADPGSPLDWYSSLMNLFRTQPIKSWLITLSGIAAFAVAILAGLRRWGGFDPIVSGTWLAAGSGFWWYVAAVVPLALPDRPHSSAGCNMAAACCAAGSACYLVPDDKVAVVIRTLSLGF
jgi:hypothetical protein